jgi:predicted nucleic acid-binding protein
VKPTHLADTSALVALHQPVVGARFVGLIVGGQVATCGLVDLELLARMPPEDHAEILDERRQFPRVPCDDDVLDHAITIQAELLDPAVAPIRLIVAAVAAKAGLILLHDDPVFERIAAITGQRVERVTVP